MSELKTATLTPRASERLRVLLTAYIEALRIIVDAMGLEGEWTYDAALGELVLVEA